MLFVKGYHHWQIVGTVKKIYINPNGTGADLYIFDQRLGRTHYGGYHRLNERMTSYCTYTLVCPD